MTKVGDLVKIIEVSTYDDDVLGKVGILIKQDGVSNDGYPLNQVLVDGKKIYVYPDCYRKVMNHE